MLSALFVNDTICLVFTPLVLDLAAERQLRPLPFLLALATASNIGSAATITGNPQNILIGSVTILGSIANLIVVEGARRPGVSVRLAEYASVGVPLTLVTLAIGVWWLSLRLY